MKFQKHEVIFMYSSSLTDLTTYEQGGYFYSISEYIIIFLQPFSHFFNKCLTLSVFFSPDALVYVFIYLILFFYTFFIFILLLVFFLNFLLKTHSFTTFIAFVFVVFLSTFSVFLNEFFLPRLYLKHVNFFYSFCLNFSDDSKINLPRSYSEKIIWYFWFFFLNVNHLNVFILYVKFVVNYSTRALFIWAISYYFFCITVLKRFVFGIYFYYFFFFFQFILFYSFRFNFSTVWRGFWLNYYALPYINFFLGFTFKAAYFFSRNWLFLLDFQKKFHLSNELVFSSFFVRSFAFNTVHHFYIFVKNLLLKVKVSYLGLALFKSFVYSFFFFLNLLTGSGVKSVFFYFSYTVYFYFSSLIFLAGNFFNLSLSVFKWFISYILYIINYIFLPVVFFVARLSFYFIFYIVKLFFSLRLFHFILFFSLLNFFDVAYFYVFLANTLDLLYYIYSFVSLAASSLSDPLHKFFFFDSFSYRSFINLTYLHRPFIYTNEYSPLLDYILKIKLVFIGYFPYGVYLFLQSIAYYKSIIFYVTYLNYFFFFSWYLFFFVLVDGYCFFLGYSWFNYFLGLVTSYILILYDGIFLRLGIYPAWLCAFSLSRPSLAFYLETFIYFDNFSINLAALEVYYTLLYCKETFGLFTNFSASALSTVFAWFFLVYDVFFYINYQYPFDGYSEELNPLTGNRLYLKYKLKSRFYKYYTYYYAYYYKIKYSNSFLFVDDDCVNYTSPFHKYKHKTRKVPSLTQNQILNIKIFVPKLYRKWKVLLFTKLKYKLIWGSRFKIFQTKADWLSDFYRTNSFFYSNSTTSLLTTFDYSFFTRDQKPGFGYYEVDSLYGINIFFLIVFIVGTFLTVDSFRKLYFPALWYVNNSEFLWNAFRVDEKKHSYWLYTERANELPLGVTKKELAEGGRFTFKDLAARANLQGSKFYSFLLSGDYLSYYKNRYPGDLGKLIAFDYFCTTSLENSPYFAPMYLRESYHHFTELGSEEKEYLSIPSKIDFRSRNSFLQQLNKFFFDLDAYLDLKLPDWTFHKELANHAYYKFPGGAYFIPYDVSNLFESANCWLILFPLTVYRLGSFEFIFSMDSVVLLDLFYEVSVFFDINYFFDMFFYSVFLDLLVIDPDSINSQWTFIRGVFDDRFFYSKFPYFSEYYEFSYYRKFILLDLLKTKLNSIWYFHANLKIKILIFILVAFYFSFFFFSKRLFHSIKFLKFEYKKLDFFIKFKFFFHKKYINKKNIYGFNNKT